MKHLDAILFLAAACIAALLTSCGGSPSPSPVAASKFLYASTYSDSSSGVLSGGIYGFSVDPTTGALSLVNGSPFATSTIGAPIAVTRDSKFLFSVDHANGNLLVFSIQSNGTLTPAPSSPIAVPEAAQFLVADPSSDHLYASGLSGKIMLFKIDATSGAVSLISSAGTSGTAPSGVVITPDGRYVYQTFSNGTVAGFTASNSPGLLNPIRGTPATLDLNLDPGAMAIDPAGKFLYITNGYLMMGYGGPMGAYSIDAASGALTPVPGSPFAISVGSQISAAVDESGHFLFLATGQYKPANCLAVWSIDQVTGTISPVTGSPFAIPCGLLITDPSHPYLYIGSDSIAAYSIDDSTGVVRLINAVSLSGMTLSFIALTN